MTQTVRDQMEPALVEHESRLGRKRKRTNVHNVIDRNGRKKAVETRSFKLVGQYVQKDFQGSESLLGRIMDYSSGLYRINYENGGFEYLKSSKVKAFLVDDGDLTGEWSERRDKLDELLLTEDVNAKALKVENTLKQENANPLDATSLSEMIDGDAGHDKVVGVHDDGNNAVASDLSNGSCEDTREEEANLDTEVRLVPPPELPPSSGHIGVPEEYVSHLLSVYSFLRSFSVSLFLHPFGLDDFVGALKCSITNTLLDSVHVALLRVLKRHFERLSLDGSDLTSKCLRCLDWTLLDTLTWPIYLVHYLMAMGYKNRHDLKGFYTHSLERDYYTLSAGTKLIVLQILCDDVLDSEELRIAMVMHEESEEGTNIDTSRAVASTCEPRRIYPRYSKTSACRDSVSEVREIRSSHKNHSMESQVGGLVENLTDEDGNGDECRLCGMDGLLICCDGCPSSYHSRCLGLNKTYMPDDSWYCPECKINATEPKILQGTALKGGHVFGVDPYEQVYVASCDHLLVLKASINSEYCVRYYSRHDIPGVIHALDLKEEHIIAYSEICRGIMQYWEVPLDILPSEVGLQLANKQESDQCNTQVVNLSDKVPELTEINNPESCAAGFFAGIAASPHTNCGQQAILSENSFDSGAIYESHIDSTRQSCITIKNSMTEPSSCNSLIGRPANPCQLSQQSKSSVIGTVSDATRDSNNKYNGPVYTSLEAKTSLCCQELNNRVDPHFCGLYMGSSFRITGYINFYLHGDFSASAASNLAILTSEENQVPESRSSDNTRKIRCTSVALQVKAFSSAAMRFFWPNTEKKLVEVPRERCTWCFSCKAPVTSKRGCLLNAAASNAIRDAMKVFAGFRTAKNGDSRLSGIATYIMFVEESLSGLLVGPFTNDTFRKQWHKEVEQATTYNAIKILLLELEENIRTIALSGDWTKLVEGCSTQSSSSQVVESAAGSIQKHRPGRRGRKSSAMLEVKVDGRQDKSTDFTWWRGGTLSKLMLRRGILPRPLLKKSARQGGIRKIPGMHYIEGNEPPKSSRQLFWRSSVEMSRNAAQLALQVRYLDVHVRWSDLVRPEQASYDGKIPEVEASAFRNAFICDKKVVDHKIRYCFAFGSQKHMPSRVMKNIAEIEQAVDGKKERYWFSENYIPLYLIKEYEEKVGRNKPVDMLSKQHKRHFKASRKSIFSSLLYKQYIIFRSSCCSCHQDVSYRNAVKCSVCQEICHEQCATSLAVKMSEEVQITCKQCCETRGVSQVESSNGSPTSPFLIQGQDFPNPATTTKHEKLVGYEGPLSSVGSLEHISKVKTTNRSSAAKGRNGNSHWGLIWRKKNCENTGIDFRLRNILLRGNPDRELMNPLCRLCNQPYNGDLMYIRCETCQHWFHADALELDESKIFLLVGFKCCKCRRIKSPLCPYLEKKVWEDKIELQPALKQETSAKNHDSGIISERHKEVGKAYSALPRKAEATIHVEGDDPLLCSLYEVKQDKSEVNTGWNDATVSDTGPQKLPPRRHNINQEKDVRCLVIDSFRVNVANAASSKQDLLPSHAQMIASKEENSDDGIKPDCELPEPDDVSHMNDIESPENVIGKWKRSCILEAPVEITRDEGEPTISVETGIQILACKICSNAEPGPDLCCQICHMSIHKHCSPWFESSSTSDWKCGSCREWR